MLDKQVLNSLSATGEDSDVLVNFFGPARYSLLRRYTSSNPSLQPGAFLDGGALVLWLGWYSRIFVIIKTGLYTQLWIDESFILVAQTHVKKIYGPSQARKVSRMKCSSLPFSYACIRDLSSSPPSSWAVKGGKAFSNWKLWKNEISLKYKERNCENHQPFVWKVRSDFSQKRCKRYKEMQEIYNRMIVAWWIPRCTHE